jgi:hypothetical protein
MWPCRVPWLLHKARFFITPYKEAAWLKRLAWLLTIAIAEFGQRFGRRACA